MAIRHAWMAVICGIVMIRSAAATPKAGTVPPTQEIAILDPNVDSMGRPAIKPVQVAPGLMQVDIPQTVIVHRLYYTGDRSFQGPVLPGGPSIVVVNHPKCGERLYVPVQMLPGSPRVIYTSSSIEYDFGKNGITLRFCTLSGQPKVEYRNCTPIARHVEKTHAKVNAACKEFADRTGLTEAKQKVGSAAKNVCADTADAIGAAGKVIAMPIHQIGQLIPGRSWLNRAPEDRAQALRDAQVQAAEKANAVQGASIPTQR